MTHDRDQRFPPVTARAEIKPYTYGYQYHDCVRFNGGLEVNGERPSGSFPVYDQKTIDQLLALPATAQRGEDDDSRLPTADDVKGILGPAPAPAGAVREALEQIASLEPQPFAFPVDWSEQIEACAECRRYKNHPIQQGICDLHRKPIYAQERHNEFEQKAIGYRAKEIARNALALSRPER